LLTYSSGGITTCGPHCETAAILTSDLITLTFDLSTSKWVMGHQCHGLPSFLRIFSLLHLSILHLRSGLGQTVAINT